MTDLHLPDGTIIQGVPDDISQEEVSKRLTDNGYEPPKPTNRLDDLKNDALSAGKSVVDVARSIPQLLKSVSGVGAYATAGPGFSGPTPDQVQQSQDQSHVINQAIDDKTKGYQDTLSHVSDQMEKWMTPEYKASINKSVTEGYNDPNWWDHQIASSAPYLISDIGLVGAVSRGTYAREAAKAAAEIATKKVPQSVAKSYIERKATEAATNAGTIAGTTFNGSMMGASSGQQVQDAINGMDEATLMNYPEYATYRHNGDTEQVAKSKMASDHGVMATVMTGLGMGLTGAPLQKFVAHMASPSAEMRSAASNIARAAASGVPVAGAQGAIQQGVSNLALQAPSSDATNGIDKAALQNMLVSLPFLPIGGMSKKSSLTGKEADVISKAATEPGTDPSVTEAKNAFVAANSAYQSAEAAVTDPNVAIDHATLTKSKQNVHNAAEQLKQAALDAGIIEEPKENTNEQQRVSERDGVSGSETARPPMDGEGEVTRTPAAVDVGPVEREQPQERSIQEPEVAKNSPSPGDEGQVLLDHIVATDDVAKTKRGKIRAAFDAAEIVSDDGGVKIKKTPQGYTVHFSGEDQATYPDLESANDVADFARSHLKPPVIDRIAAIRDNQETKYSTPEPSNPSVNKQKPSIDLAQRVAAEFHKQFGVPVNIHNDVDTVPGIDVEKAREARAKGIFKPSDNSVHLILANAESEAGMRATLAHEIVGHYGVSGLLGKDYNRVMDQIAKDYPALHKRLASQNRIKLIGHSSPEAAAKARRDASEEVFAYAAGARISKGQKAGVMQKIVSVVRNALRKVGAIKSISESDIHNIIDRAAKWVKDRKATSENIRDSRIENAPEKHSDSNDQLMEAPKGGKKTRSPKAEPERELIIHHNLTEEKLMHAHRMGGIPVPSMAITKHDSPITGFGDITLIGRREMADPKGYAHTKVFGADVYSPRYPTIHYKMDKFSLKRINRELSPHRQADDRELYSGEIKNIDDLTQDDAFKRYAESHGVKSASYHALRPLAENMLRKVGATEHIYRGYTNSGKQSYKPHTLENVVNILKKDMRGGEGFNYGVGSLRAHFTPQFKSVKEIVNNKDRLVSNEDFKKIKEEVDGNFWKVANQLQKYHPHSKGFSFGDIAISTLQDAAKMGLDRALKENQFKDVPQDLKQEVSDFLEHLRHFPTEYFEAKITRAVSLSEFSGAVVPEGTSEEAMNVLSSHGLKVSKYKPGDESSRSSAVKKHSESLGDALFEATPVYRGADTPLTAEHFKSTGFKTGNPSAGLGVFFTSDKVDASKYGSVSKHTIHLVNPLRIPVDEMPAFDSQEEARSWAKMQQSFGHDGLIIDATHLGGPRQYVAFNPSSVEGLGHRDESHIGDFTAAVARNDKAAMSNAASKYFELNSSGKLTPEDAAKLIGATHAQKIKTLRSAGLPATASLLQYMVSEK